MAITYPLALPSHLKFSTRNWRRIDVVADVVSPFTGESNIIVYPGQWVEATLTLGLMYRDEAQDWSALLAALKGPQGTFLLGDPLRRVPLGVAAATPGTPVVKGASQTGSSLVIDGCGNDVIGYLKRGDLFQVACAGVARLHEVLGDVDTNGSGEATIDIWPDLRDSPADNAEIVLTDPKGTFHILGRVPDWDLTDGTLSRLSFDCKEWLG